MKVTPSTVTDSEGVTFDSSKITVGELEMEYLEIEGRNFVLIDDVLYETETITEDEVLALQEQ